MLYEGGGDMSKGGFFVHLRDQFGRCQWAFATAQVKGSVLNLQVIPNGPEQLCWRPNCSHGPDKGQWHYGPDQCNMDSQQIKEHDRKSIESIK